MAPLLGRTSPGPRSPAHSPRLHKPCTRGGRDSLAFTHTHPTCLHTRHVHLHPRCIGMPAHKTQSLRHARECPSTDTFTVRQQNVGPREGEGVRWPGASLLRGPYLRTYQMATLTLSSTKVPRAQYSLGASCAIAEDGAPAPQAEQRGRSRLPFSDRVQQELRPAGRKPWEGSGLVGGKASSRKFLLPHPQGQESRRGAT